MRKLSPKDLDALESQGLINAGQRRQIEGMLNKQHEAVRPPNAWDWAHILMLCLVFLLIAMWLIVEKTP